MISIKPKGNIFTSKTTLKFLLKQTYPVEIKILFFNQWYNCGIDIKIQLFHLGDTNIYYYAKYSGAG